mgnify:CR=1 FL=1
MSPIENELYQYALKRANDARLFFNATGRTYAQQLNVWREQYAARPRKLAFEDWLQKRLAFIRRIAL